MRASHFKILCILLLLLLLHCCYDASRVVLALARPLEMKVLVSSPMIAMLRILRWPHVVDLLVSAQLQIVFSPHRTEY